MPSNRIVEREHFTPDEFQVRECFAGGAEFHAHRASDPELAFMQDLWRTIAAGRVWHGETRPRTARRNWVDTAAEERHRAGDAPQAIA